MEGIELVKDLATDIVAVAKKYVEAKEDDKITKVELIGMLPKAGAVIKDLMKYPQLIAQIKDIDSNERKELLDHIISLDIMGDKAEIILVNVVEIVAIELEVYRKNVVPIINVLKN